MPRFVRYLLIAALPAALVGCAGAITSDTEQMLSASGFAAQPAETPQAIAELQATPPHTVILRPGRGPGGAPEYVYADPDFCRCLYVGGPAQYRYFSQLQVQQRIASEQEQAALMNEDAAMEWSMPRPIVILHDRH